MRSSPAVCSAHALSILFRFQGALADPPTSKAPLSEGNDSIRALLKYLLPALSSAGKVGRVYYRAICSPNDPPTRIGLSLLSRLFDWRGAPIVDCCASGDADPLAPSRMEAVLVAEVVVRPTVNSIESQALIRRITNENSSGEERIANELLLKIGIRVSPRTVNKYLSRRPRGRPHLT